MRGLIPGFCVLLVLAVIASQQQGTRATHDGTGGHIDQVSIDVGPPGVAQGVTANGVPATGDRDGDTVVDAEGYDTPDPGDAPGACGNDLDDDLRDSDGDTTPDAPDGVADDGCVVPLSPLESCIEIIDNDVLDADEDSLVAGRDRAVIDITVGAQPGPGGGVPAERMMTTWTFEFLWSLDVLDVELADFNFLILAAGGAQPYTPVIGELPDVGSPFDMQIADHRYLESGAGVLARLILEGNAPGVANLALHPTYTTIFDEHNSVIPIDIFNAARVAVSKDSADDGTIIGDSPGEEFTCLSPPSTPPPPPSPPGPTPTPTSDDIDADGVLDAQDNCVGYYNPSQQDNDADGTGDVCDDDDDNDGVEDDFDNCHFVPNKEQLDSDGDGIGNACDSTPNSEHVDQLSIDVGPPGVAQGVSTNGVPHGRPRRGHGCRRRGVRHAGPRRYARSVRQRPR